MEPRKQAICGALRRFIAQRPGIEFGNYGDMKTYRAEMRSITKDRHHAETLLRAVELAGGITADDLIRAAEGAYSGRLTIRFETAPHFSPDSESVRIGYVTGQYFPTEYRRAVCAVLASALWGYTRDHAMPEPYDWEDTEHGRANVRYSWAPGPYERFLSAGHWLRAYFRHEFGRRIAARWFS